MGDRAGGRLDRPVTSPLSDQPSFHDQKNHGISDRDSSSNSSLFNDESAPYGLFIVR